MHSATCMFLKLWLGLHSVRMVRVWEEKHMEVSSSLAVENRVRTLVKIYYTCFPDTDFRPLQNLAPAEFGTCRIWHLESQNLVCCRTSYSFEVWIPHISAIIAATPDHFFGFLLLMFAIELFVAVNALLWRWIFFGYGDRVNFEALE